MAPTPVQSCTVFGLILLVSVAVSPVDAGDGHPWHRKNVTYSYNYSLPPAAVQSGELPPIEISIAPEKVVVCSDGSGCDGHCKRKHGFNWIFGHGHKCHGCKHEKSAQPSSVAVPTVATLATPVMLSSQPQPTQTVQQVQVVQQSDPGLAAVRAAQEVELALANLRGQMAAQKAIQDATQQTIDRLRQQLDSLGGQPQPTPQTRQETPVDEQVSDELVTVVKQVKEKLDSVIQLVQVHDEVLKRMHEDGNTRTPAGGSVDTEIRRMVENHQKALEIILKDLGYTGTIDEDMAPESEDEP